MSCSMRSGGTKKAHDEVSCSCPGERRCNGRVWGALHDGAPRPNPEPQPTLTPVIVATVGVAGMSQPSPQPRDHAVLTHRPRNPKSGSAGGRTAAMLAEVATELDPRDRRSAWSLSLNRRYAMDVESIEDGVAGALLVSARTRLGISQTAFAALLGVAQPTLSAYESGRRQPTLPTLLRLLGRAGLELRMDLAEQDRHDAILAEWERSLDDRERERLQSHGYRLVSGRG